MKKMLFTVATALSLVAVPAAVVSAQGQGSGYRNGEGTGDQIQQRIHDPAHNQDGTQDQARQRLHDGTGANQAECDGTGTGDMHRHGANR